MAKRKQTPDILAEPPKADDPVAAIFPQAPTRQSRFTRVKLTLPTAEGPMRAVQAYLTLALRALPGVMLVDAQADWELVVVGTPLPARHGEPDGIVVSVVVLHPQGQRLEATRGGDFCGVWLRIGALGQMRQLCQDIIARFSAKHLDATRQAKTSPTPAS